MIGSFPIAATSFCFNFCSKNYIGICGSRSNSCYHSHAMEGIIPIQSSDVVIHICMQHTEQTVAHGEACQFDYSIQHFIQTGGLHCMSSKSHICEIYQSIIARQNVDVVALPSKTGVVPT